MGVKLGSLLHIKVDKITVLIKRRCWLEKYFRQRLPLKENYVKITSPVHFFSHQERIVIAVDSFTTEYK
jgi:hypothetical protein